MVVFASKDAFTALGLEPMKPSTSFAHHDCSICLQPLAVHTAHTSEFCIQHGYHPAVRIVACGHVHGKVCLNNWLDVGNQCPTCNRMLFEKTGDPITQADVNNLVRALGPELGEGRVIAAVAGLIEKQKAKHEELRRYHEQEMARQMVQDQEKKEEDNYALSADDMFASDEEMEFGDDEEDGDEEGKEETN
ncbi:hypothetical protein BKA63DRAFT_599329 [Paraphoma chrysanthemicola]|nr:hypothetical protein BKA63DRAFT_599329 [Paraphoma chrysanthemicola]